jgi:hypothetical protein
MDIDSRISNTCRNATLTAANGGLNIDTIKQILIERNQRVEGLNRYGLVKLLCETTLPDLPGGPGLEMRITGVPNYPLPEHMDITLDQHAWLENRGMVYLDAKFLNTMAAILASNTEEELGGMIDIDLAKQVDLNMFHRGQEGMVDSSHYDDFEITYHTHPFRDNSYVEHPSQQDIKNGVYRTLRHDIVDIIFAPDAIYSMYYIDYTYKFGPVVDINDIHSEIDDIFETLPDDGLTLQSYIYIKDRLALAGILLYRHTRNHPPFNNTKEDILNHWPITLPIYMFPREHLFSP